MAARALRALTSFLALASAACSWSRFDDFEDSAPVVLLNEPGGVGNGFGSAVASSSTVSDANVLVAAARGQRGAAEYRIGFGQSPVVDALESGHCKTDCELASTVAGLPSAATPDGTHSSCWATGISTVSPQAIVARCNDVQPPLEYTLTIPAGPEILTADRLFFTSDPSDAPSLAAATTATGGRAWFYPPLDMSPVALVPATPDPGFGSGLAVALLPSGRIYAVGATDADRVWLFAASADGKSVASLGCVTGEPGFGKTIAAGDVDGAPGDELVVATNDSVVVLGGIAALAQGGSCVASAPAELARLVCVTTADVSRCGSSAFGAALAVGDLNADGNGEVIVGAPGMSVRGESGAGAIEIFDVDLSGEKQPAWLTDAKFISSAESGDALGSALVTVRQAAEAAGNPRSVLLAGAPGGDKAGIFYCFDLPSGKRGSRCQ